MQMNRRDAIKTLSIGAAAIAAQPWTTLGQTEAASSVIAGKTYPFVLAPLPYAYDALADVIDAETMQLHHGKHHAGYVTNLNKALEAARPLLREQPLEDLLRNVDLYDEPLKTAVINHGGGHHNHTLFWEILNPGEPNAPEGRLAEAINRQFGSVADLTAELKKASMSVFGSGWAWLVDAEGTLTVTTSPNQDSPVMLGHTPILGIDVWEHAYYLRYQNRRVEYVDAVLSRINWNAVAARLPVA
jgi:Fe-Mn family superoxide dismutase